MKMLGDYIDGSFVRADGEALVSRNPSKGGDVVVETTWSASQVAVAVAAAHHAQPGWSRLSFDERWAALVRFRSVIEKRKESLADAIVQEIGKIRSEARTEIQTLLGRFDITASVIRTDLRDGPLPGFPNEALRWHPHGVVGVIGPFNFPLHLCHAHVIPALLLGNTVVMKPSEVAPLCGIRYAEAAHEAGLPAGVLNVVHGRGETGAALVANPGVHGLAFTGSYHVGRRIAEAALDRPEMLVALEMGGKNTAIVCEDADIRQAAHEIVVGGYLTSGQRCTCTDRVLVHRSKVKALVDALRPLVAALVFGDPDDPRAFAGPLATDSGRDKLERAMAAAEARGATPVAEGKRLPGGFFRTGSFHLLPDGVHDIPGYTDVELFGPDLGIETFVDDTEAIGLVNGSPYGFANSIFTPSDARFDRYYRETRVGILNRNRSTNQASPRLPFGGTGRSGNFRPAGSFAARNLAIPVAVQTNIAGAFPVLPALRAALVTPDLDQLEARHVEEEREESARTLIDAPRPLRIVRPKGGAMPRSTAWLERFHANDRIPREKKPAVFDHLRSHGPYFVSVDDAPLSVLDAMSQTATMPFGLSHEALVRAYVDGDFGDTMLRGHTIAHGEGARLASQYAMALRALVPGYPTVSFTACGAEANEKAYALARIHTDALGWSANKLLAFEGSFHGRTLLSLYASHSPAKRAPFEIAGYEVDFVPFPRWDARGDEPAEPEGFRAACAAGDPQALVARFGATTDPLLRAEVMALAQVAKIAAARTHFAVVIEPMQSEGGDRYATARFHRALRLVTRAHGVPLIMDEVQCGFGLGGDFAWHSAFGYVDRHGGPDHPDCVVFAKRAQVGVVMSVFPDPEPTEAYAASLVRGRLHASRLAVHDDAARVEALVKPRLEALFASWGHRIGEPRARGLALAFDLRTPAELNEYLAQRFWRGAIVFGAGDRTVRYRLNASFGEREIDQLFLTIRQSLAWLEAHPGKKAPEWEDLDEPRAPRLEDITVREAGADEVSALIPQILALETRAYEPARRDPESRLRAGFVEPDAVAIVAERSVGDQRVVVGYAIALPLEQVAEIMGPDRDPARGRHDSIYSAALTVDPDLQNSGLGRRLKHAQLRAARDKKGPDGKPRFRFCVGRNRVGVADAMSRLNDELGAHTIFTLENVYDREGTARYYRQPLRGLATLESPVRPEPEIDLGSGLVSPFASPPPSLIEAEQSGLVAGAAIDKITLCNYVTPAVTRATEWAASLVPDLPHLFMTNGRDETIDKSVRMLRWQRKSGRVVLSFAGAYVGHTTACARSVSDPSTHRGGPSHFDFPHVPHPAQVGEAASIDALRQVIRATGADAVLGIYAEMVQERTGRTLSDAFIAALDALRAETGVPIVLVETASAYYRSGRGAFACSPLRTTFVPDALVWWTGGQQGFVHVTTKLYVPTPLTFVSTWDGDELSLLQAHHQLRAARNIDVTARAAELDAALSPLGALGVTVDGVGLYRVIAAGSRTDDLVATLEAAHIRVGRFANGGLSIAPSLDRAAVEIAALGRALAAWR
jgi:RHH-type transcriptional regulator, proline utilization regulon repressor / proline dehydrogenase / delta 1-pyrroline-5-carboxylate dehydrogenase